MTSQYSLHASGHSVATSNPERFLDLFEDALRSGQRIVVGIARSASATLRYINTVLREHGVELRLDIQSDPEAADYVMGAMAGAAVGSAVGAGAGALFWWAGRLVGCATPLVAVVLIGTLVGGAIGAATGTVVTHWGLTVRFSQTATHLELEFSPCASVS